MLARRLRAAAVVVCLLGPLAACSSGSSAAVPRSAPLPVVVPSTTSPTPSPPPPAPVVTTTAQVPLAATVRTAVPSRRPSPTATSGPRTAATSPPPKASPAPLAARLKGTDGAGQVVSVTSDSAGSSYATLQLWQRGRDGSWTSAGGPWAARIGRNGFSSAKREGDGRTPVGSFAFGSGFGVRSDPGYRFGWLPVTSDDVWVDDPASALYNTRQREPADGRWTSAEQLYQPGPYAYAALIRYNTDPVRAGAGSAIFFHVGTGGATAGCVSLPAGELLTALRWLDPAQHPRIVMGPVSAVT